MLKKFPCLTRKGQACPRHKSMYHRVYLQKHQCPPGRLRPPKKSETFGRGRHATGIGVPIKAELVRCSLLQKWLRDNAGKCPTPRAGVLYSWSRLQARSCGKMTTKATIAYHVPAAHARQLWSLPHWREYAANPKSPEFLARDGPSLCRRVVLLRHVRGAVRPPAHQAQLRALLA